MTLSEIHDGIENIKLLCLACLIFLSVLLKQIGHSVSKLYKGEQIASRVSLIQY